MSKCINPGHAWYLKKLGYPQPSLNVGQVWANEFCHTSKILHVGPNVVKCMALSDEHIYTADRSGIMRSSAYVPRLTEVPGHEEGMSARETVEKWLEKNGGNVGIIE